MSGPAEELAGSPLRHRPSRGRGGVVGPAGAGEAGATCPHLVEWFPAFLERADHAGGGAVDRRRAVGAWRTQTDACRRCSATRIPPTAARYPAHRRMSLGQATDMIYTSDVSCIAGISLGHRPGRHAGPGQVRRCSKACCRWTHELRHSGQYGHASRVVDDADVGPSFWRSAAARHSCLSASDGGSR